MIKSVIKDFVSRDEFVISSQEETLPKEEAIHLVDDLLHSLTDVIIVVICSWV